MADDNVLRRWFSLELGKLLDNYVPVPKPLADLVRETTPSATTRSGGPHLFDREALLAFAEAIGPLLRTQVRLPLTLHIDNETPGDAFASDPASIESLQRLGVSRSSVRDGRLWVSMPLLRAFASTYPTIVQFVMH